MIGQRLSAFVGVLFLPLPLSAQAQSQVQPAAAATFSSSTHLVVEAVTVRDKNGKVVEGLKKDDFAVTEDGKPQEVKFFDFENVDDVVASSPSAAPLPPPAVLPELTAVQIAPEPPGDVRYKDRRLLALYFDINSMPILDQLRALDEAEKFIRARMSPADMMAIMEYNGAGVEVLQDFTADRDRLQSIIAALIAAEADNTGDNSSLNASSSTGAAFGQNNPQFTIFNTDRQLAALQTATKMLGALNEKKVLVYFASGLNLSGVDNQAQLRATINDAIRSGVSFWPIDARGLVALPPLGGATQASQGNAAMYTGAASLTTMTQFEQSQDTLYTLAADTGGKAFLDHNDLAAGIVAAEKSITSFYVIGYYTTNTTPDGKFRRVKISVSNNPEAKLDYRQGYYANKVFGKFTTADKERQLEDALMMGDPVTELTMALEVNYFRQNSAEYFVPVMVKIPGSELALARKGGAARTQIDFIGEIRDNHGTTIRSMRDHKDIQLSHALAAEWEKRPVEYDTGYTLLPGAYQIKVLARDSGTGRMGTFLGKFYIPNLDLETQRVPISSVVLSSQRVAMSAAVVIGNGKKAATTQASNPLVQDGEKLIPSVTRVFHSTSNMYVYFQAYEPNAVTTARPLVAYVSLFQRRNNVMETPPMKVTQGINLKSHMLPVGLNVPLGGLKPGEYDCEVTVLDPAGQKGAFWQAPVMIIP
ncbi:MAG TPA: VWA domain-containing protein [Candidatus Acidoferrales bacterium]|jgi:VWFA-related protein|nr:VWA domain-containing protein [Candidatus Acidoferrales bacterium]